MKFNNVIVAILAATFLGTLGIVGYVGAHGGDVDTLIYLVMVVLGAAAPGVVNQRTLKTVKENTNGTLSGLMQRVADAEATSAEKDVTIADLTARLDAMSAGTVE